MLGATILPVPRRIYIAVQIAGYIGPEERFTDLNEIVSQTMYKDISSSIHIRVFVEFCTYLLQSLRETGIPGSMCVLFSSTWQMIRFHFVRDYILFLAISAGHRQIKLHACKLQKSFRTIFHGQANSNNFLIITIKLKYIPLTNLIKQPLSREPLHKHKHKHNNPNEIDVKFLNFTTIQFQRKSFQRKFN